MYACQRAARVEMVEPLGPSGISIQKRNLSVDPCSVCDPFEFRHHLSTFKVSEFQVSRRQLPTLGALLSGVEIFEKWLCPQQLTSAFQVCETETSK